MKKTRFKVRFNLGRGPNYMKWKVQHGKQVWYYDPEVYSLHMINCTLKNHKKTAEKIHLGAEKSVCAWVLCDLISVSESPTLTKDSTQLKYNPRVTPNWTADSVIVDNCNYDVIWSVNRKLFTNSYGKEKTK